MKYWKMPEGLQVFFQQELRAFQQHLHTGNLVQAWHNLERAHIIGQRWTVEHTRVHWKMLRFGFTIKNYREVMGQLPRLLVGGVKSFVGKIPVGNTGGTDVPPLKPMEIPPDLQAILRPYINN